jgi:hypothetical protein
MKKVSIEPHRQNFALTNKEDTYHFSPRYAQMQRIAQARRNILSTSNKTAREQLFQFSDVMEDVRNHTTTSYAPLRPLQQPLVNYLTPRNNHLTKIRAGGVDESITATVKKGII